MLCNKIGPSFDAIVFYFYLFLLVFSSNGNRESVHTYVEFQAATFQIKITKNGAQGGRDQSLKKDTWRRCRFNFLLVVDACARNQYIK